jgi:hypothetical protein
MRSIAASSIVGTVGIVRNLLLVEPKIPSMQDRLHCYQLQMRRSSQRYFLGASAQSSVVIALGYLCRLLFLVWSIYLSAVAQDIPSGSKIERYALASHLPRGS